MKKFISKIIAYILLVLTVGNIIVFLFLKIWPSEMTGDSIGYFVWNFVKNKAYTKTVQHKNVIIGDSRALTSLSPNTLQHNFINLSLSAGTPFEAYLAFKRYLQINTVDTLIVSFTPIRMEGHDEIFKSEILEFNFFKPDDISDLEKLEKKFNCTIENEKPNAYLTLERKLIQMHFPTFYRSAFIGGMKDVLLKKNSDVINAMKHELNESGHCFFGREDSSNSFTFEISTGKYLENFKTNEICLSYLDSIWRLSCAKNIKVIFVTTPINYASYQKMYNTKFYTGYNNFIDSLTIRYPGITVWKKYPFLPNTFFGDPNHVNSKGCDFFSRYIRKELDGGT